MKFSICIPHFNRIEYLVQSLDILKLQNYSNFEVVISDDCSSDNTAEVINEYILNSKFPIIYNCFSQNQGYDRNLRKSMELATGDYCFILGNDDALSNETVLWNLSLFLLDNNFPDLGFCNYCEFTNAEKITRRANYSGIIGKGPEVGLKRYSSFSFVAGLIFKKSTFDAYNTDKFDRSIYAQIALALNMICNNCVLFSINEIWVRKDITFSNGDETKKSNSYRDFINRNWFKIKPADGGLISVINVLNTVLEDNKLSTQSRLNYIFHKLLFNTYPYWILDYKNNNATPAALGLFLGLQPYKIKEFSKLGFFLKIKYIILFQLVSVVAFITPSMLFFKYKDTLYTWLKRK